MDINNKIVVGYVDDDIDLNLQKYLSHKFKDCFAQIKVEPQDTIQSIVDKIVDKKCNIVILDSKLYKDNGSFAEKITGQNLEVILQSVCPYISSIVISQEEDNAGLNYIEKYKGNDTDNRVAENNYKSKLDSLLDEYCKKQNRIRITYDKETKKSGELDKALKDNIKNEIHNLPVYDIKKDDIDRLIEKIESLEVYVDK